MISAIIQVQFLKHGLLTRGGIASGSYFVDDMMVWGTALVKAHSLENSIAVYPRIVVDPELIGDLDLANPNSKFITAQEKNRGEIDVKITEIISMLKTPYLRHRASFATIYLHHSLLLLKTPIHR